MLILTTDGSAQPRNPGNMAVGYVIHTPDGELLDISHKTCGFGTNNEAEYLAVIHGLEQLANCYNSSEENVAVWCDSQLLVRQINDIYKVRDAKLRRYYKQIKKVASSFNGVTFRWHRRTEQWAPIADMASKSPVTQDIVDAWVDTWVSQHGDKPYTVDDTLATKARENG